MWYMRGSLSREEAWAISPAERQDITELIEDRIKMTRENKMSFL